MSIINRQPKKNSSALSADQSSIFCYQLSLMLKAGIGSEESVALLLEDAHSPQEKMLLEDIHKALMNGQTLSEALATTNVFSDYLLRMVEIGQASGRLEQVLEALSEYYRRDSLTQGAIRKAITYPTAMALLIALVFLLLMARVLPVFQQVFNQLGLSLSPITQSLLTFGSISKYAAAILSVILLIGGIFLFFLFCTQKGAKIAATLGAKFFSRSAIAQNVNRSRFSSAMALMLSSGLPLDEAIERTQQLLEHSSMAVQLQNCQAKMNEGCPFAKAVEDVGILTGLQAGLLTSGFRAGMPEKVMEKLADRCQEESDNRLAQLLNRFEYALVIILCVSVGLVLLSVMLPLLGVMSSLSS